MDRSVKRLVFLASVVVVAVVASGCELALPITDCSWVNQPDMGGLVCLGANGIAIGLSLLALIAVLLTGLG